MAAVRQVSIEGLFEVSDEFAGGRPEILDAMAAIVRAAPDPLLAFRQAVGEHMRVMVDPTPDSRKLVRGFYVEVDDQGNRSILE